MEINGIKVSVYAVIGVIGSAIAKAFGGWSEDLLTLIIFMAIDYLTGLIVAGVFRKSEKTETGALNSNVCFKGLCKKCAILLMTLIAHRLDVTIGADYIRSSVIIAFAANELLSVTENIGAMGAPMPNAIKQAIDLLKKKEENK